MYPPKLQFPFPSCRFHSQNKSDHSLLISATGTVQRCSNDSSLKAAFIIFSHCSLTQLTQLNLSLSFLFADLWNMTWSDSPLYYFVLYLWLQLALNCSFRGIDYASDKISLYLSLSCAWALQWNLFSKGVCVCVCSSSLHSVRPLSLSPLAVFWPMVWQQEVQAPDSCSEVSEETPPPKKNKGESKTVYMERNINKAAGTIVCPDWANIYIMKGMQGFSNSLWRYTCI